MKPLAAYQRTDYGAGLPVYQTDLPDALATSYRGRRGARSHHIVSSLLRTGCSWDLLAVFVYFCVPGSITLLLICLSF